MNKVSLNSALEEHQREIDDASEGALYRTYIEDAVMRGRAAIQEGCMVKGIDTAQAEVAKRRAERAVR